MNQQMQEMLSLCAKDCWTFLELQVEQAYGLLVKLGQPGFGCCPARLSESYGIATRHDFWYKACDDYL